MKKIITVALSLHCFFASSGIIVNKKTMESFEINLLENAEVLQIHTNSEYKELPLRRISKSEYRFNFVRRNLPNVTKTISNYDGVCGPETWRNMQSKREVGRVAEVLFLSPVALVVYLVSLPRVGIDNISYNRDFKI